MGVDPDDYLSVDDFYAEIEKKIDAQQQHNIEKYNRHIGLNAKQYKNIMVEKGSIYNFYEMLKIILVEKMKEDREKNYNSLWYFEPDLEEAIDNVLEDDDIEELDLSKEKDDYER